MRWRGWLIATLLAACSSEVPWLEPDASLPDAALYDSGEPDGSSDGGSSDVDAGEGSDSGVPADAGAPDAHEIGDPVLISVEPSRGGASAGATVLIRGENLGSVVRVELGDVETSFERLDAATLRAEFPPVSIGEVGLRPVRVVASDGYTTELAAGFEYLFDEDPIVFVHGYMGNAGHFESMVARFRSLGYPADYLRAISISDPYGSNLDAAGEVAALVDHVLADTGAPKVDLVSHSMGGVASRLFIKLHGGSAKVRDFAAMAGSHHGAYMYWPVGEGGSEMATTYACEGDALNDVQFILNGCLTASGRTVAADETPAGVEDGGAIAYLSLYSDSDDVLVPDDTACLNQEFKGDCSDPVNELRPGLRHLEFLQDQGVFNRVVEHVRARNQSK